MRSRLWQLRLENRSFSAQVSFSVQMWYTKYILVAPGKAAGQLVGFGVAATELGIGWVSVWVSVWALQIYDSAILACDNNLDLMCVFMASGGIGFSSSVSVYNGFGLRNKLRDGPLHNEKSRGISFSPHPYQLGRGKRRHGELPPPPPKQIISVVFIQVEALLRRLATHENLQPRLRGPSGLYAFWDMTMVPLVRTQSTKLYLSRRRAWPIVNKKLMCRWFP